MGRHSSGTKNYRLAGWMWIALVAILVIVALIFGWNALRSSNAANSAQQQCTDGDYNLKVWASESRQDIAEKLASQYNEGQHIVRDSCVKAEIENVSDQDALKAVSEKKDMASVWIPEDAQAAAKGIEKSDVKLASDKATVVDGAPILTLGSGDEDEMAARAGSDFSSAAAEGEGVQTVAMADVQDGSFSSDATTASAKDSDKNANKDSGKGGAQDVTFLLETSNAMGVAENGETHLDLIRVPIAEKMLEIGKNKGHVGLWNYSSPLNPGVTKPFRANVDISVQDDGNISAARVDRLGYGGAAYTYDSLMAAYSSASYAAANSQVKDHRLVLITASPNQGGGNSLDQALAFIKELNKENPVQLDIVTVGSDADTASMKKLAEATGGKVYEAKDSTAFKKQLDEALK